MFDLKTDFGQLVSQRLKDEDVIWLTTVSPRGAPQPNPVWFYWDDPCIIMYSKPDSYRIRNLQHSPLVALNLQPAGVLGDNVAIMHGKAKLTFNYPQIHPGYVKKYAQHLVDLGVTLDELVATYTVEIRVEPKRLHD